MTDNEIIKALEGCSCDTLALALDLINRQKAKIESLEISLEAMRCSANGFKSAYEREKGARNTAIQDFAEQLQTEIHQALESNHKAKAERMANPCIIMADEFISYCEGKIHALQGIDEYINNIVKELIGEQQ